MAKGSPYVLPDHLYLFNQGRLLSAYRSFGAHVCEMDGNRGVKFTVWAPNALEVRIVGDFNGWDGAEHRLHPNGATGVWTGFAAGVDEGALYMYELVDAGGRKRLKADPFAFQSELRPGTASVVTRLDGYNWQDRDWMIRKKKHNPPYGRPLLIYEVHLGSWRMEEAANRFRTYTQLADELVDYVASIGYTHIELLPITEHPLDRSWGYQTTGYYSVTSRYGPPEGLKQLVDRCHQRGIGVLLDWVPGHFCKDDHGLKWFDGTPLYEDPDTNRAEKPNWGTLAFHFGKPEVQSFLLSNALFWLDVYHMDGFRVDAVASMIDMNFDKPAEMRTRNRHGGPEHLEALDFLRRLNETVFAHYPDSLVIAEDSSAWPGVTSPTYRGGLGFNYKWNMGWMNDLLRYMETDPDDRPACHSLATFPMMYAYSENYILPLSHDEVVHGKRSLLNKMPGSYEEKFANLRLFYGYWFCFPGKKLLFMGGEYGQTGEWKDDAGLDWLLLGRPMHARLHRYMREMSGMYVSLPPLWELDHSPDGFEWIDSDHSGQSVLAFIRNSREKDSHLVAVCNFSRSAYSGFRIGVPADTVYQVLINSDAAEYGGRGSAALPHVKAELNERNGRNERNGQPCSLTLDVPPLTFLLLKPLWTANRQGKPCELQPPEGESLCEATNASPCCWREGKADDSAY